MGSARAEEVEEGLERGDVERVLGGVEAEEAREGLGMGEFFVCFSLLFSVFV